MGFILISGGSASGKTTFAKKLVDHFGQERAAAISLDSYLDKRIQPQSHFIEGIPNFDNPSMINWSLLLEHMHALLEGRSIETPVYDFHAWMPTATAHFPWKSIVILEGIHVFQPQLDSIPGLRIYLDVDRSTRYARRVFRDTHERHYPLDLIHHTFFKMALPSEKLYLVPAVHKAHLIFKNLFDSEAALAKVTQHLEKHEPRPKVSHPSQISE